VDLPAQIGSYEPLIRLASGGMASLYVARHAGAGGFERLVVIKRVHRHLLANREFCDMFLDEARISSLIRHSNVVPVIDIAEASSELFLVLEYVESLSLEQLLAAAQQAGELLPPPVVSRIMSDALAGLHAAHEALDMRGAPMHVVHRDVSPHNILVDTHGMSSIIDFGIAKAASRIATTSSGQFKGKLRYMAPEQVKQQPSDRRADLVPVEREGSIDEDLLEDSSNRIEEYLRGQGYRDARAPHAREEKDGELRVRPKRSTLEDIQTILGAPPSGPRTLDELREGKIAAATRKPSRGRRR